MTEEEPRWLSSAQVLLLHEKAIERHGGLPGVRDENALESAVFRPQQFYAYQGERDLFALAALYAEGVMTTTTPSMTATSAPATRQRTSSCNSTGVGSNPRKTRMSE